MPRAERISVPFQAALRGDLWWLPADDGPKFRANENMRRRILIVYNTLLRERRKRKDFSKYGLVKATAALLDANIFTVSRYLRRSGIYTTGRFSSFRCHIIRNARNRPLGSR